MPRKDFQQVDIHKSRSNWYKSHMESYQFAKTYKAADRKRIAGLLNHIRPEMTVYGGFDFSREQLHEIFAIAKATGVDHWHLCWWWWSDEGYREFERLWSELPEPVSVHKGLCTSRTFVHS